MSKDIPVPRPCPFCGSKPKTNLAYGAAMVWCDECECLGFVFDGIKGIYLDDVIEHWNKRATSEETTLLRG